MADVNRDPRFQLDLPCISQRIEHSVSTCLHSIRFCLSRSTTDFTKNGRDSLETAGVPSPRLHFPLNVKTVGDDRTSGQQSHR